MGCFPHNSSVWLTRPHPTSKSAFAAGSKLDRLSNPVLPDLITFSFRGTLGRTSEQPGRSALRVYACAGAATSARGALMK